MLLNTGSLQSLIPETAAKAGWQIDQRELDWLLDTLNIKRLVIVRYSSGRYNLGLHKEIKNGGNPFHRITVSQILDHISANETLLHEIRHAYQAERWAEKTGRPIWRFYKEAYKYAKGQWGQSYMENSYEIDCREFAHEYLWKIRLVTV